MKIAAVVILYYPDETAITNIKTYYDFVDQVFVFDNTETAHGLHHDLLTLPKVQLHHDRINKGIAERLNAAAELAIKSGFDWLLTMDQDSNFLPDAISNYVKCFEESKQKENVAVFGTKYSTQAYSSTSKCAAEKVERLITSASLLNLGLYKKIGPFDEALFIDAVDYDYCARATLLGYSLIRFSNIVIQHQIGKQVHRASIKTLFLFKKKKEIHSAIRLYYMYRNLLYLEHKYKNIKQTFTNHIRDYVLSHIKICLLYGRDTTKILRYLLAAKRDFKSGKMGKIAEQ